MTVIIAPQSFRNGNAFLRSTFLVALAFAPPLFALTGYSSPFLNNYSFPMWGAELLMVVLLACASYENGQPRALMRPDSLAAGAVLLLVAISAAFLNAPGKTAASLHTATTATHLALAVSVYSLFSGPWKEFGRSALQAALLGGVLQIIATYAIIVHASAVPDYDWVHFFAGVSHVRQLGFVGLVVCALASALAAGTSSKRAFWLYASSLLLSYTFLNLIGGRSSLAAGLLATAFAVAFATQGNRTRLLWVSVAAYAVSVPLSYAYMPADQAWGFDRIIGSLFDNESPGGFSSYRLLQWQISMEKFLDHPWIGHGEGQYRLLIAVNDTVFNHPHNFLVQFLFQWGLIGTIAAGYLMLKPLRGLRSIIDSEKRVALPAMALVLSMAAMATLEGNFFHLYPSMMTVFALALISAGQRARPADHNQAAETI